MSIKKSATFSDSDFEVAARVAEYQRRTFANYIVHCVMAETKRRIKDVEAAVAVNGDFPMNGRVSAPGAGKPH